MKLAELREIRNEIDRFSKVLDDSIEIASDETVEVREYPGGKFTYTENSLIGSHANGHLKREYLSLKYNLTKIFNGHFKG